MKQSAQISPKDFLPAGTSIQFDGGVSSLKLGDCSFLEGLGWYRKGLSDAVGGDRDIVEIPPPEMADIPEPGEKAGDAAAGSEIPGWFSSVLSLPQCVPVDSRLAKDGHLLLLLGQTKSPTLARLIQRRENLGFFMMTWIGELARFFVSVHEAGYVFRRIAPDFFALDTSGKLVFLRPDQLKPSERASGAKGGSANPFSAPEASGKTKTDELADQFGLALLIYSIIAQGIPFQTEQLPSLRIFVPDLPHGIETAIRRALSTDPQRRFPSCRAFAEAMLSCALTLNAPASNYRMAASTEIGRMKKQSMPVNQDAWFIGYDANSRRGLLLLADGISTADVGSGDLASAKVFEAVRDAWEGPVGEILRTHTGTLTANWHKTVLEAILDDANTRIYSFLKQPIFVGMLDPMTHSPGSTAILGLLDGDKLTLVTIGDSCLYVLRNGTLELHSVEQNLLTRLIQERRDPRDVSDMDTLSGLTHSIGNFYFDNDGGIQIRRLEPRLVTLNLCAGDRILMCSDGVPDCLGNGAEQTIAQELAKGSDPQQISATLCRMADDAMGADNITALVLIAE